MLVERSLNISTERNENTDAKNFRNNNNVLVERSLNIFARAMKILRNDNVLLFKRQQCHIVEEVA